jgi:hypothetical protein
LLVRRPFSVILPVMRNFLLGWLLFLAGPLQGAEIKLNFDPAADAQVLTNFHAVLAGAGRPGVWTVLTDVVPPQFAPVSDKAPVVTGRPVLAQTSQDSTDERFPIFVYDKETFSDFKLTARFKIVSGNSEEMAGMVFRFQNASNFYVIRASALGHNVRFYKMVNGVRSDPIGPQLDVATNVWHDLTVQCTGNQMIFWLDQKLLMPPLNDNTFTRGNIGLWTKSDAVSYFSDLTLDYTPEISAAQVLVNNVLKKESRLLGLRIYTLDREGKPAIIASNEAKEIGQTGGDAEKAALTDGKVSFGRGPDTVAVWLPYRDRNGDPMAAVWIRLKSFTGETQDHAITRATYINKAMQQEITSSEDLLK